MAKCDEGYRCDVCGGDVTSIVDSDLYLRFVAGLIPAEELHLHPERHLRCNAVLSQYIEDTRFEPLFVEGDFDRRKMDPAQVQGSVKLFTRAYRRLWEILETPIKDITRYPLATREA